jgi:hypothetical protein
LILPLKKIIELSRWELLLPLLLSLSLLLLVI